MDMCIHLECLMKIKRRKLHDDSCTHISVAKSRRVNEDLCKLDKCLRSLDFTRSSQQHAVYFKISGTSCLIIGVCC